MQPFAGQPAGAGGSGASGATLLHSALYGVRSGSSSLQSGTALYRNFNAPPRDKGILAAAVDDAFMSPEPDPVSIAAAVDPMAIDAARYNAAAAALIGDKSGGAADGTHRLNLGVVNLAAAASAPDMSQAAQQQMAAKGALYGNYQQVRAPLAAANGHGAALYGNIRNGAAAPPPPGGDAAQGLRRYTAAQLHQLSVVRQLQLRQQAAAQQPPQPQQQVQAPAAGPTKEQQAHVLACAAEVAQQVAARQATATEQQRRAQQQQPRAAVDRRVQQPTAGVANAPPPAAAPASNDAAAAPAVAAAQSALYKRAPPAEAAAVLYKRPALSGHDAEPAAAAAVVPQQQPAAARGTVSALYGAFCADRHAASSAASAVVNEMMGRLGHGSGASAAAAAAAQRTAHELADNTAAAHAEQVSQTSHMMVVSPAQQATPDDSSHCSETAFLDCHEDLSDDIGAENLNSSGGSSATSVATGGVKVFGHHAPQMSGAGGKATAWRAARPYGPIYCPTVYSDVSSPHALALANEVMGRISLPGGIQFMPLSTDSMLYYNGVHWGFSAFALALGSSYFQRLLEHTPALNAAVRHAPHFVQYVGYMRDHGGEQGQQPQQEALHKDGLRSILFTCAYLATKVVDRMPHTDMLRRMLSLLCNAQISREDAHSVELKCLDGLGYRLGPYFIHNLLEDEPPCCDLY